MVDKDSQYQSIRAGRGKRSRLRSLMDSVGSALEQAHSLPAGSLRKLRRKKKGLLNTDKASEMVGLSVKTMANMRSIGEPELPYVKIGSRIFYHRSDLVRFRRDRKFRNTSEYPLRIGGNANG